MESSHEAYIVFDLGTGDCASDDNDAGINLYKEVSLFQSYLFRVQELFY